MSAAQLAIELEALAQRIRRMPGIGRNGDMDPFFEARSQAARDAQLLADWQRTGRQPAEFTLDASRSGDGLRTSYSNGRGARVR